MDGTGVGVTFRAIKACLVRQRRDRGKVTFADFRASCECGWVLPPCYILSIEILFLLDQSGGNPGFHELNRRRSWRSIGHFCIEMVVKWRQGFNSHQVGEWVQYLWASVRSHLDPGSIVLQKEPSVFPGRSAADGKKYRCSQESRLQDRILSLLAMIITSILYRVGLATLHLDLAFLYLGSFDFKRFVTIHTGWFGLIYQLSGLWSFAAVICLCVKDAQASSDSLRGFCRSSSCELELQHVGLDTQWAQTREPTANYLYLEYYSI